MASVFKSLMCIVCVCVAVDTTAQLHVEDSTESQKKIRISEVAFYTGFGVGQDKGNIPEGTYRPLFFIGRVAIDLIQKHTSNRFRYQLFLEPQFNKVLIGSLRNPVNNDFEYGLNIGFQHLFTISPRIVINTFISTGPHYISVDTRSQANGFIFSDNFGIGCYFFLYRDFAVNVGFRLRHMSNAQLKMPNSGINTYNFMIGFCKMIKK